MVQKKRPSQGLLTAWGPNKQIGKVMCPYTSKSRSCYTPQSKGAKEKIGHSELCRAGSLRGEATAREGGARLVPERQHRRRAGAALGPPSPLGGQSPACAPSPLAKPNQKPDDNGSQVMSTTGSASQGADKDREWVCGRAEERKTSTEIHLALLAAFLYKADSRQGRVT